MHSLIILAQAALPVDPNGDTLSWALQALKWAVDQFKNHNAWMGSGMVIMVLVWAAKTFLLSKLNPKALPWVSMGLGTLAGVGANLLATKVGSSTTAFLDAGLHGALLGAAASGLWEALGQHVEAWLKTKFGVSLQPPAPPAPPAA